jgi:large subunit ribosomal protein L16
MFEMAGVSEAIAKEAMRLASYKLPIDTIFMVRKADNSIKSVTRELAEIEG